MEVKCQKKFPRVYINACRVIHVIGFFHFTYGIVHHNVIVAARTGLFEPYLFSFKFLSIWNLTVFATAFFLRNFVHILVLATKSEYPDETGHFLIRTPSRLADLLSTSLAYPYTIFSSFYFWLFHFINPFVNYPPEPDEIIEPFYINYIVHVNGVAFIFLDVLFQNINYPKSSHCLGIAFAYGFSYMFCILFVFLETEVWVFRLFSALSFFTRTVVFIASFLFITFAFYTVKLLNYYLWSRENDPNDPEQD